MAKSLKDARGKLELSHLENQAQLLSTDLDISELSFITKNLPNMRFEEAVIDGEVNRTIEGASTVNIRVNDHYSFIKNSGRLGAKVDIKIDGLWFRLVKVTKQGDVIDLTFESREVAILRTYDKKRLSAWGQLTRARFVQILVNEVKEFHIPFICPELHRTQYDLKKSKAQRAKDRDPGFGSWKEALARAKQGGKPITIKGAAPTTEQLENAEKILDVGTSLVLRRKLLVCAIMTAITETTIHNRPYGFGFFQTYPTDPLDVRASQAVGIFQQMPSWGSFSQRMNITHAAKEFYTRAQRYDAAHPKASYGDLCQAVQVSAYPDAYALWRVEAERIVTAYGIAGGDTSTDADTAGANLMGQWESQAEVDKFQFARGRPKTLPGGKKGWEKEDSWICMNRLAEEIQWRAFEVSGEVYFMSEPRLFKSAPRARLSEESDGVDWIDFDYDVGKKNAQVTISAYLDRWAAPPGSTIAIVDSGVINGRWLVTNINRKFFDPKATVTLKKPRPKLPEPKKSQVGGLFDNQYQQPNQYEATPGYEPDPPGKYPHGKALRDAVLNSPNITFTRSSQQQDITMGLIKPVVLRFLLAFTEAGFPVTITALKSDHKKESRPGHISAHWYGLAVDMGNYSGDNATVQNAMTWIGNHQTQLKFSQLIGPTDSLVIPLGNYDTKTLAAHDDHIHVGWPI